MNVPFEEPAKTEMRGRCEIAIDQAGHELVEDLLSIDLPADLDLQGKLKGDIQSLDGEGNRYCYYLRPTTSDTLPKWLANLAGAAHRLQDVRLYIVVENPSPPFEKACKAAGAGLLVLNADNEFAHVLDFETTLPAQVDAAFAAKLDDVRRSLEAKVDLHLTQLQGRFETVGDLTQGMDSDVADQYTENIERQYKIWRRWADGLSEQLDDAYATRNPEALVVIGAAIEQGPVLDSDI